MPSPFFIIPWERVSWLFSRLSLCLFLSRSLGFLLLFSNSHFECFWPRLTRSSLLPDHHKNHLIWEDSSLMAPLELRLALSTFGHCSCSLPPCLTVPRTIYSEWTRFTATLGLHADLPLEFLFRTVNALLYIDHSLYIVYISCHILSSHESFNNY